MKMLASLIDIPEFQRPNVYIINKDDLLKKINLIISDGRKKLQIVTDFDHTLTRHNMDDGSTVLTSYGMFKECPSVPQYYKEEVHRLAEKYKPIEVDPTISVEEKTKFMIDWYYAANNLLKGLKFPQEELEAISESMKECFRIGVRELISWSEVHQVPVLVFSAGLGDCVKAALKAADLHLPHVKLISNFLEFDETGLIVGVKEPLIHVLNKNETAIKNTEYYEMVKERNNVLLMGDNIGDAMMADGMDHCDVVIKIGFLGRNTEANLQSYINTFDIVLLNDNTMDVPNSILRHML